VDSKIRLTNGAITGMIGGKALHLSVRPAQPGSHPPPGNYVIHPPVNDPIYGMVALMTASSPGGGSLNETRPNTVATAHGWNLAVAMGWNQAPAGTRNQAFVLSSRPILGQKSLVVTLGFADLMDALQGSGGAAVTVS
jgi:hypothetical protein